MLAGELESLIARAGDLPAMPAIAVKVMEMVGDPTTSARKLQDMIIRDQALTAKVLKIANSAMFGVSRDINTLSHAIVILGFSTVRSIVLAASTKSIYFKGPSLKGLSAKLLWKHSLASAIVARRIAMAGGATGIEEAFVSGLLHDIGKGVLNVNFHEKYAEVIDVVLEKGVGFREIEQNNLGFDHTQVGALVLRKWNLGKDLEEAVLYHHSPDEAVSNRNLTSVVALANEITNKMGIGPTGQNKVDLHASAAALNLGYSKEKLDKLFEDISGSFEEDDEILSL